MIVFCPDASIPKAAEMLDSASLLRSIQAVRDISMVVHETADDLAILAQHPSVHMWNANLPWLINLGQVYLDHARYINAIDIGSYAAMEEVLSLQMDLATTEEFSMDAPWFWGTEAFHVGHLSFLATMIPERYLGFLKSGDADFNKQGLWPVPQEN